MLAALVGGEFLLQQVGEGVVVALLLKVGTGDASGIVLRPQVVHLPDLAAVLALGNGGRIAGGRLGGFRRVGGKGGGGQAHGKSQDTQQPGRVGDGFPLHRKITSILLILGAKKPRGVHGAIRYLSGSRLAFCSS